MTDIRIQFGKKMGISFGCLKSYCMAYRPHKAGYIHSTVLSLGEYKLEWKNKLRYMGIYFANNPNRLFEVQE